MLSNCIFKVIFFGRSYLFQPSPTKIILNSLSCLNILYLSYAVPIKDRSNFFWIFLIFLVLIKLSYPNGR